MTEDELLREVQKLAKLNSWLFTHFRSVKTPTGYRTPLQGDPGFPDCVLAKQGYKTLHVELKTERGTASPAQLDWLVALDGVIIRPSTLEWLANKLKEEK